MSEVIYSELKVFLIFFLHGAGLLLCSDLLRSWRLAVPHGMWWTSLEDVIFWFAAAIWTFVLIFRYQDGSLRFYMALAGGAGMYIYRKTLSPWVIKGISGLLLLMIRWGTACVSKSAGRLSSISRFFQKIDIIRQKSIAKNVERE